MPFGLTWDIQRGRTLYDAGVSYARIAAELGVSTSAICHYAKRCWPDRPVARHAPLPRSDKPRKLRRGESTLAPLASLGET